MKKGLMLASLIAGSMFSHWAMADKEAGISFLSPEVDIGESSLKPTLVQGQIGADIYSNLMAELRFAIGVGDDDYNGVNVKIANMQAVYLKMHLPIGQGFKIYGLAGYSRQNFSLDEGVSVAPFDNDHSCVSAGFGGSFKVDNMPTVFLEYVSYYSDTTNDMGLDVSGFSLGVNFSLE